MRTNIVCTAAAIAAITGVASAGTLGSVVVGASPTNNMAAAQLAHYNTLSFGGAPIVQSSVTNVSGANLTFGSIGSGTISTPAGGFYLGTAQGLNSVQPTVWFNTVGGIANVGNDTTVLGFANSGAFSANQVTISFQPGVQGVAFNYADIGDVSVAELVVTWSDGQTSSIPAMTTNNDPAGYVSLIAAAGRTISSLTLTQDRDFNDGFMFYGFSTMAVVPLPPAAWAGLALLGGMAGVRKLRRR